MLFQLLDEVCARIDALDVMAEAPRFAAELRRRNPRLEIDVLHDIPEIDVDMAIRLMSMGHLSLVKAIPSLVSEMRALVQSGACEPAFRCVLAATLAYTVQPRDLLPDDLPGGYGFVDDALMLHEAAALSWDVSGDMARAEDTRRKFQFIFEAVPPDRHAEFKEAVRGMAVLVNIMRMYGPELAAMTTEGLIAYPLQATGAEGGAGTAANPFARGFTAFEPGAPPQYTWQTGNLMGINFPGGGGVATDGRDIFPLG